MPSIYNKDKPWDTEDIDKWKIEQFKPEDNVGGHFVEESSFATLFPKVGSSTPATSAHACALCNADHARIGTL
jgi:hypothetical protein